MDDSSYFDKVNQWNQRSDYKNDLQVISLLTNYSLSNAVQKDIFIIGTGLGADLESLSKFSPLNSIVGIEPITEFYKTALEKYEKFQAKLFNVNLKTFSLENNNLSGVFIFSHSINHISKEELSEFAKSIKKSYIVISNPNPEFPKRFWWTDDTILHYLSGDEIANILNCEKIFDFFYNLVEINNETIFVRNAIVLKTKDF